MPRRKYTPEQIISKLREAEVQLSQVHRLKELERENARLKKLVADLSLDNAILKEAISGN
jgi:putative transposase